MQNDADLIADLRKEAAAWFNNSTLLKFEELLRRYQSAMKVTLDMKASAGTGIIIERVDLTTRGSAERMILAIKKQMDLVWPQPKEPSK